MEFFINFTPEGTELLAELTQRNIDNEIYIVYKGKIISRLPVIGKNDDGLIWITFDNESFNQNFVE